MLIVTAELMRFTRDDRAGDPEDSQNLKRYNFENVCSLVRNQKTLSAVLEVKTHVVSSKANSV